MTPGPGPNGKEEGPGSGAQWAQWDPLGFEDQAFGGLIPENLISE